MDTENVWPTFMDIKDNIFIEACIIPLLILFWMFLSSIGMDFVVNFAYLPLRTLTWVYKFLGFNYLTLKQKVNKFSLFSSKDINNVVC